MTTLAFSLTAPPATDAARVLRPGVVAEADPSLAASPAPGRSAGDAALRYRRSYGTGRWVRRQITPKTAQTYLRDCAARPVWDSCPGDAYPYLPAEVADRVAERPIWLAEEAA